MKKDLNDLKKLVVELIAKDGKMDLDHDQVSLLNRYYDDVETNPKPPQLLNSSQEDNFTYSPKVVEESFEAHEEVEESLSLEERERELIKKALEKHKSKRKYAALELGISERTLYRKIKEYNLTE
jgi:transcriptional regulator with PAS, ATPase and Fis domain